MLVINGYQGENIMSLSKTDKLFLQLTGFMSAKNKVALQGSYTLSHHEKKGLYFLTIGLLVFFPLIIFGEAFHDNSFIHHLVNFLSIPVGLSMVSGFLMLNTRFFIQKEYKAQRLNTTTISQKKELNLTLDDLQQNKNSLKYNNEQEKEH